MAVTRRTEPWTDLLDAGRADERLVREAFEGAREPRLVAGARRPAPGRPRRRCTRAGSTRLYSHQAEALEARLGRADDRHDRHRLGQVAVLQPADARRRCCGDSHGARAVPLPDEGARPGPGARAERVRPGEAGPPGDLRRRHPARGALGRSAGGRTSILTNPDMLHVGILPNHGAWGDFFANLAVVVVDEAHVYRGVFGSHVANVLRRLRRVAGAYGTEPRFLFASATIANPVELAERLTGLRRRRRSSTATARPAPGGRSRCGTRRSSTRRCRCGAARWPRRPSSSPSSCARGRGRSASSSRARRSSSSPGWRGSSSTARPTRTGGPLADRVAPYRAGYTPQQRRELEAQADERRPAARSSRPTRSSSGSTSARSTRRSCVTFPGTVASLRQMWGRAGRRGRGLAVYIAGEDALDQFFCRHPEEFLERPGRGGDPRHENEPIHLAHLLCAAHEGPLDAADAEVLGAALAGLRGRCSSRRACSSSAAGTTCCGTPRTIRRRACRCARRRPTTFAVVDVDGGRAARDGRGRARALDRPRRRGVPAHGALVRGRASSTSTRGARSSRPSTATGTRSPRRRR